MENKIYDYTSLVDVVIEGKLRGHIHEDFENYYKTLLSHLETLFNVRIPTRQTMQATPNIALAWLFVSSMGSLVSIHHPLDHFLEASLISVRIDEQGELGDKIRSNLQEIGQLVDKTRQQHRQLLYDLLIAIYGPILTTVTSQELFERGFDDTPPDIQDYWDYI